MEVSGDSSIIRLTVTERMRFCGFGCVVLNQPPHVSQKMDSRPDLSISGAGALVVLCEVYSVLSMYRLLLIVIRWSRMRLRFCMCVCPSFVASRAARCAVEDAGHSAVSP